MSDVTTHPMIGRLVRYTGDNRDGLYGLIGVVERVNGKSAAVRYEPSMGDFYKNGDGLVWAALWAWTEVEEMRNLAQTDDLESLFLDAAGGPAKVIKSEIERLEARLSELRIALKVIESL